MGRVRRPDIDALRAFAILTVLGYHLKFPFFTNGFIGVDIFFIISGYLITEIIIKKSECNSFNLWTFYLRRANRLLPALLFTILLTGLLIWIFTPLKIVDYAKDGFWTLTMTSNIYYYATSGYFSSSAQLKFLLHTWSLSLEAQFYLIYPLILSMVQRVKLSFVTYNSILWGLWSISLFIMFFFSQKDGNAAFYLLPPRLWEFLSGGMIFMFQDHFKFKIRSNLRKVISLISWALLIFLICKPFVENSISWPSLKTMIPVILVSIILMSNVSFRIYETKFIQFISRHSYGLYLLHWPLIVLSTYLARGHNLTFNFVLLVSSLLLAITSHKYIESKNIIKTRIFIKTFLSITLICLVFPTSFMEKLLFNEQQIKLLQVLKSYKHLIAPSQFGFRKTHLLYNEHMNLSHFKAWPSISSSKPNYLLIGDCHAGMFSSTLKQIADEHQINLIVITMDETFPTPNGSGKYVGPQLQMNYIFEHYIPSYHHKIEKVILMADYTNYSAKELSKYFDQNKNYFKNYNLQTIYLGQTKKYSIEYPVVYAQTNRWKIPITKFELQGPWRVNSFIKKTQKVDYVDLLSENNLEINNSPTLFMYDANHYTIHGTESLSSVLSSRIFTNKKNPS